MSDNPNGAPVVEQKVVVLELAIRWLPQTGQLQVVGSQVDDVTRLGMLELAKAAILKQSDRQAQTPLIVPGRFAS